MEKIALSGLLPSEICEVLSLKQTFRGKQIFQWIGKGAESFDEMTNLSVDFRNELKEKAKACITYDKKREEPLKLRDAVELSVFFEALDKEESVHFFKESLFKNEEDNEYCGVLKDIKTIVYVSLARLIKHLGQ